MKRVTILMLAFAAAMMLTLPAHSFTATCPDTGKRTAAGSYKDAACVIHCGNNNPLPAQPDGIKFFVTPTANGVEIEACSDTGPGNQHGRLVEQIDANQGRRLVLDSDKAQTFGSNPGYDIVQTGLGSNPSGIFCNAPSTSVGGDGYERSWSNPGPTSGPDCPRQIVGI